MISDRKRTISTQRIKSFALSHLPPNHPLREVILAEKDGLSPEEFLSKMEIWLVLLNRKV